MTRDFSDETKEELLKNIDEEYNTSVFNGPPMGEGNLAEDLYNLINTPWLTLFALDGALTAKNIAAKREIEAIWEEVYKVAGTYDTKIQHLYSLAEALKKKIEYITVTLTPTGTGDTGYAVIDSLPEEFQAGFTVVNNAVNNAKNTMTEYLLEEMVIRNDNGEIVDYNYDVISELMDKNADDITSVEYKALAYAFIGDGSISDDARDKHIDVQNLIINGCYDVTERSVNITDMVPYNEFECVRNDKFDVLYEGVLLIQDEIYAINETGMSGHNQIIDSQLWYKMGQNKTVLDILKNSAPCIKVNVDINSETPVLLCSYGWDNQLCLEFSSIDADFQFETGFRQKYIISTNKYGDNIEDLKEEAIDMFVYKAKILEEPDAKECLDEGIRNVLISVGADELKIAKEFQLSYDFISPFGNYYDKQKQYNDNVEAYDLLCSDIYKMQLAQNYGLGVVSVTEAYSNVTDYYFYEGIGGTTDSDNLTTKQIIENVNSNINIYFTGEGKIEPITMDDVLVMSEKIYVYDAFVEIIKREGNNEEQKCFYDGIVERKIE